MELLTIEKAMPLEASERLSATLSRALLSCTAVFFSAEGRPQY